jgi:hypothetical protein
MLFAIFHILMPSHQASLEEYSRTPQLTNSTPLDGTPLTINIAPCLTMKDKGKRNLTLPNRHQLLNVL